MSHRATDELYFITTTVVEWIDIFTRPKYKHIVIESLQFCQKRKGLRIFAWVLMSNHLHMIVGVGDVNIPLNKAADENIRRNEGNNGDENIRRNEKERSKRERVADIIRDFKKFTSMRILAELKDDIKESRREWMLERFAKNGEGDKKIKKYRFWQEGYHPELLYTLDFFRQKLNYIHQNPVRQEFVERPEDYVYSSAICYATDENIRRNNEKGLLDVEVVRV